MAPLGIIALGNIKVLFVIGSSLNQLVNEGFVFGMNR
jgi:hypothetical protein